MKTRYVILILLAVAGIAPRSHAQSFTRITNAADFPFLTDVGNHVGGNWVDYNNDGWPDLFLVFGWPSATTCRLYRNNGDGTFTRMTSAEVGSLLSDVGDWCIGSWGDFNNDGYKDVYLSAVTSPNALYLGSPSGRFTRVSAAEPALTGPGNWPMVLWGDFDGNGWLDIFVSDWPGLRPSLYLNTNGGFVAVPGPLSPSPASVEASTAFDLDGNGTLDLIVTAPTDEGGQGLQVYLGDGNGNFTRVTNALTAQTGFVLDAAIGDYDNNGLPDACVVRFSSGQNSRLFRNIGGGQFTRLPTSNLLLTPGGSALWGDLDNDGYLDLFICGRTTNQFWHNNGDGTFTQIPNIALASMVTIETPLGGLGDYNKDGFLDLILMPDHNLNTNVFFFQNNGNSNHWLMVKLEGTVCNRAAIGAKVRVKATIGGQTFWQLREMTIGSRCGDDLRAHFGLGDATSAEIVRVEWPSGQVTELRNVASKQFMTIVEPNLQPLGPSTNGFQLTLKGRIGSTYNISTCTDLAIPNWQLWRSVTCTNSLMTITDTNFVPWRFYKSEEPLAPDTRKAL
jgi:enediyne biosynthesis protein E4